MYDVTWYFWLGSPLSLHYSDATRTEMSYLWRFHARLIAISVANYSFDPHLSLVFKIHLSISSEI